MSKEVKKATKKAVKKDIPLAVNGSFMDIINASIKDAKNRRAKKKA